MRHKKSGSTPKRAKRSVSDKGQQGIIMRTLAKMNRGKHQEGENHVARDSFFVKRKGREVRIIDMELNVTSAITCNSSDMARRVLVRIKERLAPDQPKYEGDLADFARDVGAFCAHLEGVVLDDTTNGALAKDFNTDTTTAEFEAQVAARVAEAEAFGDPFEPELEPDEVSL